MSLYLTEAEKHLAAIDEPAKLNEAFDQTGITFHSRPVALAALKATGSEVVYDDAGEPFTRYDSEYLSLSDALTRLAFDQRETRVDGRTLPRNGAGSARPGIASKSDFTTVKERSDFITKNGFDAYERLPLTAIDSSEIRTQADFLKLPSKERSRRYGIDPDCFAKLPKAEAPHPFQKALDQKENMKANLAKHIASRGTR
jgi:hypothetical protein